MLFSETLTMILLGYTKVDINSKVSYLPSVGTIVNNLLFLVIVLFFYNIRKIRGNLKIPTICWAYLMVIPIFSVYFIILLFQMGNVSSVQIIICTIALFLVNVFVSYLYDFVIKSMGDRTEKMLLGQKNENYKSQFDIMYHAMMEIKAIRHDLKNHCISIKQMLDKDEVQMAESYIDGILSRFCTDEKEGDDTDAEDSNL